MNPSEVLAGAVRGAVIVALIGAVLMEGRFKSPFKGLGGKLARASAPCTIGRYSSHFETERSERTQNNCITSMKTAGCRISAARR